MRMDGHETFAHAVDAPVRGDASRRCAAAAAATLDDIDLFVYHQANARILDARSASGSGSPASASSTASARYGNTSAATIPIALAPRARDGRLTPGAQGAARGVRRGLHLGARPWSSGGCEEAATDA